ncbi:MAG TPA: LysE family transporter [Prolixibacteraceae bacterium]
MEYLSLIGTVTLLNLLAVMSPGPDFVMVVRNSLCYSRRAGVYTSLGISTGLLIHLFYCLAGIGLIISKSVVLFSIIKILGAGYLIYLGTGSILSKSSRLNLKEMVTGTDLEPFQAFKIGFLTNILNPKVTLFMLSIFTFVIGKDTPLYVILIISVIILLTALIWFSIVSTFFTQKKVQKAFFKYEYIINSFLGIILIFIGVKIALTFLPL